MAHYTITIKTLIDNHFDFGLDDYPIFNETYRNTLNEHILNYYYENEIGFETAELFKFYLNNTLKLIMPKYNILYEKQETALLNIFGNVDLAENSSRSNTNNVTSNSASISNNKNLFQDTPQGQIDMTAFDNQAWATNLTLNNTGINDTTSSNGTGSETYGKTIRGNNGNKYTIEVLEDIKNKIMNIDLLIINELKDLFMGIF